MMEDLKKTITDLAVSADINVAGYMQDDGTFLYEISKSEHLPAAALLLDSPTVPSKTAIYTNLREDHWLYTYKTARAKQGGLVFVDTKKPDKLNVFVAKKAVANKRSLKVLAGNSATGPLGKAGGLFKAAEDLAENPVFYKKVAKDHSKEKGLHRALRYYMLAAYAALGKCATVDYKDGNYVCALAVSDSGQIISWGVNSGSFHHGEVNMLLNYFSENATAKHLPPNTIIFSTLTPCKQCSGYIESVREKGQVAIFMGQEDTGEFGREGAKYGMYLRDLTDPVQARVEKDGLLRKTIKTENKPTPTKTDRTKTTQVKTIDAQTVKDLARYSIDDKLKELITDGSIAGKIGETCKTELIQSYNTLNRKFIKPRVTTISKPVPSVADKSDPATTDKPQTTEELADQIIKVAVLTYLRNWLGTVGTATTFKIVA
jgi:tRNA(Arg) A34 adenosine deaminase TadA